MVSCQALSTLHLFPRCEDRHDTFTTLNLLPLALHCAWRKLLQLYLWCAGLSVPVSLSLSVLVNPLLVHTSFTKPRIQKQIYLSFSVWFGFQTLKGCVVKYVSLARLVFLLLRNKQRYTYCRQLQTTLIL